MARGPFFYESILIIGQETAPTESAPEKSSPAATDTMEHTSTWFGERSAAADLHQHHARST